MVYMSSRVIYKSNTNLLYFKVRKCKHKLYSIDLKFNMTLCFETNYGYVSAVMLVIWSLP